MNINDFRCMRQGQVLALLNQSDIQLLKPYEKKGEGRKKALLMIHGFSSSPAVFRSIYPQIKGYDYIKAPILPGHAQSIHAFSAVKSEQWLKYVEQECEVLLNEYEQVDVLGLSLGGLLACHLSQNYPLNRLVLLAPALNLQLILPSTLRLAKGLKSLGFQTIRNLAGNIHTPNHCEITYRQIPISTIIEILTLIQNFPWQLPTCPTDVFLGRYDEVVSSKRVAARFADAPHTRIHWLKHSAHVLPLDGDCQAIIASINTPHLL